MGFFSKQTTIQTIEKDLSKQKFRVPSSTGEFAWVIFDVLKYQLESQKDEINFSGEVKYSIDTDFGGGPATAETTFEVVNGKLTVDLDSIDFENILDLTIIDDNAEMEDIDDFDEE